MDEALALLLNLNTDQVQALPCPVFALAEDLEVTGITSLPSWVAPMDYAAWVALTERHQQQVAWY